jgi:hypothetical protein
MPKTQQRKVTSPPTSIRLTAEMLEAIDEAATQLAAERPGQVVGRADTIRALLAEALTSRKVALRPHLAL